MTKKEDRGLFRSPGHSTRVVVNTTFANTESIGVVTPSRHLTYYVFNKEKPKPFVLLLKNRRGLIQHDFYYKFLTNVRDSCIMHYHGPRLDLLFDLKLNL